jgi:H+-transporting ATPase
MCHNKAEIEHLVEEKVHELGSRGIRSLALARQDNEDGKWSMLGILTFLDPPRPDTKSTIEKCGHYGVRVKMITGDHLVIAKETARVLGMGPKIYTATGLPVLGSDGEIPDGLVEDYGTRICPADGFASVFPEHKYLIVETLRQAGFRCGMTGDGVNDAPALKRADVGIAVQGATDAARAAADLVLTGEGLSTIIDGIEISREIFARLKNFISYRIAATLQLLTFFFISVFAFPPAKYYTANGFSIPGEADIFVNVPRQSDVCPGGYVVDDNKFLNMDFNNPESIFNQTGCSITLPMCEDKNGLLVCQSWPAFFQLPVLMLMLITLLNDGALISVGYDTVKPSAIPEQWNLARLFIVATVMGGVAMGSSLLLLAASLDSNNPNGIFAGMGLPPMEYGKIVCMVYLKVSLSDFLTLFSCRTQEGFFWTVTPGKPLVMAVFISLTISTFLASFWPQGSLDGLPVMGLALGDYTTMPLWVWIYCIIWWFIQDVLKVLTIGALDHFKLFPNTLADMSLYDKGEDMGNVV